MSKLFIAFLLHANYYISGREGSSEGGKEGRKEERRGYRGEGRKCIDEMRGEERRGNEERRGI